MPWYLISVYLHLLAASLWIGHMVFWVVGAGTITKRLLSPETRVVVIKLRDEFGQIGWPSLAVLVVTGSFNLYYGGITFDNLLANPRGWKLGLKLLLVMLMILLQGLVSPTRIVLGWINLLIALAIIGLSVFLVR